MSSRAYAFAKGMFRCIRAESLLSPVCSETRTVSRPRAIYRLIMSRIWASSISISRGNVTEISLCFRLTELSSTVILKPSWEQSPRPYPVIDFIEGNMRKMRDRSEQNPGIPKAKRKNEPHCLPRHLQTQLGRCLGHVLVTAPAQIHKDELVGSHSRCALDHLGDSMGAFQGRNNPLEVGQFSEGAERLIVSGVSVFDSLPIAQPGV